MDTERYTIEKAIYGSEGYEGLRALWCTVFDDRPEDVDVFYENFGSSISGYVVRDSDGRVCSALTCHPCGTYEGKEVIVSYAVCTREDARGQGLAAALVSRVRDEVTAAGGISLVSPAEPGLVDFYARLGYEPCFFAYERTAEAGRGGEALEDCSEYDIDLGNEEAAPPVPAMDVHKIKAAVYNKYRESFLADRPHIKLSTAMLGLIESEHDGGLYAVNRGDAIFALKSSDGKSAVMSELMINPLLAEMSGEMDGEIASMIAESLGSSGAAYRMPGDGYCQSMVAGTDLTEDAHDAPYYGFPID